MADIPSAAQSLYPGLPSESASVDRAPSPDRSAAQSLYGNSPTGGIDRARSFAAGGIAKTAGSPAPEPGTPAGEDWLKAVSDRGEDHADRADAGASATDDYLDLKALKLDATPVAGEFSATARQLGLDQASAGKLAALHTKAMTEASTTYWTKTESDWASASRREFGARLPEMISTVQPLLADNTLTTKGFRDLLDSYKLGSNPDFIETLSRWAQAMRRGR